MTQLDFLEIGINPHLGQGNDRHQGRASRHPLAQLHGASGHIPIDRRRHSGALARQIGFAHPGGGDQHAGVLVDGDAIGHGLVAGELLPRCGHARGG